MSKLIARLDNLPRREDKDYIEGECSQALTALKGGVRVKDLGFEAYVEYECLRDYVRLAEQGHPIIPQEVYNVFLS